MSRSRNCQFEKADLMAAKAADEIDRVIERLTSGLGHDVAPAYAMERMVTALSRRSAGKSFFLSALDRRRDEHVDFCAVGEICPTFH